MKYRAQRYPTRYNGDVETDFTKQKCLVVSISTSGACLTMNVAPDIGDTVSLIHPFGEASAVVKWVRDDEVGVAFKNDISSNLVDRFRFGLQASIGQTRHQGNYTEMR